LVLAKGDFAKYHKAATDREFSETEIALLFQYISRVCKRIIAALEPSKGDANLAAIDSAFERLNYPRPCALNEPTCGYGRATLRLHTSKWCVKRRSKPQFSCQNERTQCENFSLR
jgi:hypothetical protein